MKNIAIIIHSSPHGSAKGREALDLALALSALNHITVIFTDKGIFHLLPDQQPDLILMRDYIATFNMLELYDIEDVYVSESALKSHNLSDSTFNITTKVINHYDLNQLLDEQDVILTF
ncbi:sulfurtransferase complex subunit TusC [Gilliamella sp. wkB308]|uniref:sulfurtransferase complex subunit TusC n=1 Tax=Gilliamella sp. wkB308 TaxID=3120263 RepID=UPI00080DE862|nr:sulfurtransferase complex subunit TusC [Gilliamella apicola]OCF99520.1 tRNA 2-thiouridine(34) synthase TusC [Gilliamella apicola]